jgi:hypothetical protein
MVAQAPGKLEQRETGIATGFPRPLLPCFFFRPDDSILRWAFFPRGEWRA